jgi:hypothetical protein
MPPAVAYTSSTGETFLGGGLTPKPPLGYGPETHLLASVIPKNFFRLANARHEARTLPPQNFCQVYAYAKVRKNNSSRYPEVNLPLRPLLDSDLVTLILL